MQEHVGKTVCRIRAASQRVSACAVNQGARACGHVSVEKHVSNVSVEEHVGNHRTGDLRLPSPKQLVNGDYKVWAFLVGPLLGGMSRTAKQAIGPLSSKFIKWAPRDVHFSIPPQTMITNSSAHLYCRAGMRVIVWEHLGESQEDLSGAC